MNSDTAGRGLGFRLAPPGARFEVGVEAYCASSRSIHNLRGRLRLRIPAMSLAYTIDANRRLIVVRAAGVLTEGDVTRVREHILRDPAFDPSYDQLFDASNVEDIALSKESMARLADTSILAPAVRRAFVAMTTLQYGMARMFTTMSEQRNHVTRVFRGLDEAEAWLAGPDAPR